MEDVDVAVVGAGPTGLALACELRLAGVSCRVLERRAEEPNLTRAFAVHARTLELLDARGLADELMPHGIAVAAVAPTPGARLDLGQLPSRYPMVLIVPQSGTEQLLATRAVKFGAEIIRGATVTGLTQDADGVRLELDGPDGPDTLRAGYVVGADGAHSTVRRLIGVAFAGRQYQTHILLADVRLDRAPAETLFAASTPDGLVLFVPFGDGWFRAIAWDRRREQVPLTEPVTVTELRSSFRTIAGDDFGMGQPRWSTRFLSERRQAAAYRVGRVFLAGDAAHVHSPIGGQGMNTGIQDAMNLGWKLAADLGGWGPAGLLDSYQAERHPVGAMVLSMTDGLYRLVLARSRLGAAGRRLAIRNLLRVGPLRRQLAGRLSGLGISYPAPAGSHPLAGRRMPDLVDGSGQRLYEALRAGRFVLAGVGAGVGSATVDAAVAVEPWSRRVVPFVAARSAAVPAVVLVRPDGYVAWAGDRADDVELGAALRRWCGPA